MINVRNAFGNVLSDCIIYRQDFVATIENPGTYEIQATIHGSVLNAGVYYFDFVFGDGLNNTLFRDNSLTHILCLYFTIYYMKVKMRFFYNCINWLMPGGYLVVHLVDKYKFDPILPPGNPLYIVSPQKYAKERITKTKITFNDFVYDSNFKLDDNDITTFNEKFKFKYSPQT